MPDSVASKFLCDVCNLIFVEGSYERWAKWLEHNPWGREFSGQHHSSFASFARAVTQNCWICVQINSRATINSTDKFEPLRYYLRQNASDEESTSSEYQLQFAEQPGRYVVQEIQPWTPLHSLAETVKEQTWTGVDKLLDLAKRWLETCQEQHPNCSKSLPTQWYPTRLLVISKDTIRLVISSREHLSGPYATLSHCWGTQKFWVLTKDNLLHLLEGVPLSMFQTTFQQAITTVRHLGINCLWIDSYCIIQGLDAEAQSDWAYEAERMGQVYSNTLINIAACHAEGPTQGLFLNRGAHQFETLTLSWCPLTRGKKSFYRISTERIGPGSSDTFLNLCNSKLATRGWAVQESILSPRMLSFNGPVMSWQCSEVTACKDFPWQSVAEDDRLRSPFWALTSLTGTTQVAQHTTTESARGTAQCERRLIRSIRKRWFDTMTTYGETSLTYPDKDIFKAIDGVAQRVAQLASDFYQHGLMENTMPQALLWTTKSERYGSVRRRQAPTWHWASWPHQVNFRASSLPYFEGLAGELRYSSPEAFVFMANDCHVLARVGERDLWPSLMCIGRLLKVKYNIEERQRGYFSQQVSSHHFPGFHGSADHGIALDPKSDDYAIFPLVTSLTKDYSSSSQRGLTTTSPGYSKSNSISSNYSTSGLLLQAMGRGIFRRIGTFHSWGMVEGTWRKEPTLFTLV